MISEKNYIDMETGKITNELPEWVRGYGDTSPYKRICDLTTRDLAELVSVLMARVAELEANSYSGPEDVGG